MTFKTKKEIIDRLRFEISTRPSQALKALEIIYSFQTEDETLTGYTSECNDYGFNSADSEILSSFARQYQKTHKLSDKQMQILMKKIGKYAGQIFSNACAKGIYQKTSGHQWTVCA